MERPSLLTGLHGELQQCAVSGLRPIDREATHDLVDVCDQYVIIIIIIIIIIITIIINIIIIIIIITTIDLQNFLEQRTMPREGRVKL